MGIVSFLQYQFQTRPNPSNPTQPIVHVQPGQASLYFGGVLMDVTIGVDAITSQALLAAGHLVPNPIITKALVDTGCTVTSIDQTLVTSLNLRTLGFTRIATANGITPVTQHEISLNFPGTPLSGKPILSVQSANLANQPFHILIGRDLMSNWTITYNGPAGFVSIAD